VSGLDPSSLDREKAQALVPIAIRRTASGHSRRYGLRKQAQGFALSKGHISRLWRQRAFSESVKNGNGGGSTVVARTRRAREVRRPADSAAASSDSHHYFSLLHRRTEREWVGWIPTELQSWEGGASLQARTRTATPTSTATRSRTPTDADTINTSAPGTCASHAPAGMRVSRSSSRASHSGWVSVVASADVSILPKPLASR
jgi:hypothetical protein